MGLLKLSGVLIKKRLTVVSLLTTVGGMLTRRFFVAQRARWERLTPHQLENALDAITAHGVSRGAGKLVQGWFRYRFPQMTIQQAEKRLKQALAEQDQGKNTYEKARSRLLISKALFYMEGFQLKPCRYEVYQRDTLALLKRIPAYQSLNRQQVFQGQPFEPEELIGAAHHLLYLLDDGSLRDYIAHSLQINRLQSDADYMAQLLAKTYGLEEARLFESVMLQWLKDYRAFKLNEVKKQEKWVHTSLGVVSGEAPAKLGLGLLGKVFVKK